MTNDDMQRKIPFLRSWCQDNEISQECVWKVFNMLELGVRKPWNKNCPSQFPSCYIQDDNAKPWHDSCTYPWVQLLEDNFEIIREEALNAVLNFPVGIHPDNENFAGNGTWNTFFFYKNGMLFEENIKTCQRTVKILKQIPGVQLAGRTYFSTMSPSIHIKTHCGPHNFKLRTHLGLKVPQGATIRVGSEERPWLEGKCIVFDDSFDHEVWNKSDETRIVLIVDTWNPSLTENEIQALAFIMPEFYKHA